MDTPGLPRLRHEWITVSGTAAVTSGPNFIGVIDIDVPRDAAMSERLLMALEILRLADRIRVLEANLRDERARIRRELLAWLAGDRPEDAGIVCGRRVVLEIYRICPTEPEGKEE